MSIGYENSLQSAYYSQYSCEDYNSFCLPSEQSFYSQKWCYTDSRAEDDCSGRNDQQSRDLKEVDSPWEYEWCAQDQCEEEEEGSQISDCVDQQQLIHKLNNVHFFSQQDEDNPTDNIMTEEVIK